MKRGAAKLTYTWSDNGEKEASCVLNKVSEDERLQALIKNNSLLSIHSSEPSLNDIFIDITGRTLL
ncbi:hypothetical protein SDC9_205732 [bioreactor metagenome]|uniref:DUF4162 domain-containing protein n=1 Tax=bioreactor metagenome TaxID=1076179 RepID=A0A645J2U7_9ZZZZ